MKYFQSQKFVILPFLFWFSLGVAAPICTVNVVPLNFGNYDPLKGAAIDITTQLTILCDTGQAIDYTISLSKGASPSYNSRQIKCSSKNKILTYNLFTNASRTSIWGDGTGGTVMVSKNNKKCNNGGCVETIYARLSASQITGLVGAYNDQSPITVTLNYQ